MRQIMTHKIPSSFGSVRAFRAKKEMLFKANNNMPANNGHDLPFLWKSVNLNKGNKPWKRIDFFSLLFFHNRREFKLKIRTFACGCRVLSHFINKKEDEKSNLIGIILIILIENCTFRKIKKNYDCDEKGLCDAYGVERENVLHGCNK